LAACAALACKHDCRVFAGVRAKRTPQVVIPAKAGIHPRSRIRFHPSGWAEERSKKWIRASDCLSVRVLARPHFLRAPQVARSEAQGPGPSGRLLFAYFLLAKQEKVSRPPGRDPACWQTSREDENGDGSRIKSGMTSEKIGAPFVHPSVCAEERRQKRIRACDCLSRRRVRARPGWTEHRRLPSAASAKEGRRQQGRLFFGDFLLARQKKVTCRRATPGLWAYPTTRGTPRIRSGMTSLSP
jgi:hypothetical protein